MSRMAKSTWGTSFHKTRRLFTSVVAPRIDYAAIIWHRPGKYGQTTQPPQTSKLESAPRTATKAILGAFRTTATSALEIESGLMPPHIRLRSRTPHVYTRMATLPLDHPAKRILTRASAFQSNTFISPLEHLSRTFPEYSASTMETVQPYIRPPWWIPITHIDISSNKKEAKKRHDERIQDPNTISVYTDGSGIDGQIGAAAFCPTISETRQQYIGT